MSTLTEQFSAVRKSQVEAQINFFQDYSARAVESVQKILALNLQVSRASVAQSSAAVAELLAVKDPRDLFALTKRSQESFEGMLAYQRQLLAITSSAGAATTPAPATPEPNTPPLALVKPEPEPELQAAAEEPVAVLAAAADPVPSAPAALPVKAKPLAKAVSKVAAKPQPAAPVAAPVAPASAPLVVSGIEPVDAAPPPLAQQQLDLPPAKGRGKKK